MNIAIIGAGNVGRALGRAWQRHDVVFGVRHTSSERIEELATAIGRRRASEVVMSCHGDHPEWSGTTLTWNIKRDGDHVSLNFTHSGWKSANRFLGVLQFDVGAAVIPSQGLCRGTEPGTSVERIS